MKDVGRLGRNGAIREIAQEEVGDHHAWKDIEKHHPGCQECRIAAT